MANTRSAKKNVRKNEVRRVRNNARRSSIKTAIKKVYVTLESGKADAAALKGLLNDVASKLARAKNKNVLHPNTASRKLSRLAKRVSKALQSPA